LDNYKNELGVKKFTKNQMEKMLASLVKNLNDTNEKQKILEKKVESLSLQNEGFIIQNQQIIQEVINKNDYTKKLETLLLFIIDVIMPKQSYKQTPNANINTNTGLISSCNPEFKSKANNDPRNNVYKATVDEQNLRSLVEKYYMEYSNVPSKESKILAKLDLPPFSHRSNNLLGPAENNNNPITNRFDEDKNNYGYKSSPNPFENEFFHSNIFGNSPINTKSDPVDALYKQPTDSCNNIINNLARSPSYGGVDEMQEFFKNSFQENNKEEENNHMFDSSYLSISSCDKK
jgi:hypothetical protein